MTQHEEPKVVKKKRDIFFVILMDSFEVKMATTTTVFQEVASLKDCIQSSKSHLKTENIGLKCQQIYAVCKKK